METTRLSDPGEFLERAGPLLLEDEARHNLMFGITSTVEDNPGLYPEFYVWLVTDGTEPLAAALRTPPHSLVLARPRDTGALSILAAEIDDELPGIVGALPEGQAFADAWAERHSVEPVRRRSQGVFALERVLRPAPVSGSTRDATEADRPLLTDWMDAFTREALHEEPDRERAGRMIDHRLSSDGAGFAIWEDGGPVSLAGYGGRTPNGIRIGPVYTPPDFRGRGYASALVAQLSQRLLDEGRRFCFLYTDLANPTANRIYERIGYRRVCESAEIEFAPR